ncbi:9097_t:CDS:2 [Funneliformis geosporum]|uniref:9097_t:CDS:1 n=1 Tax=Funneliformis geosporum TaxID=1117311 RepID=A0A9W4T348_9GLOM|nr:9097_t:CDS:2 [Funneliformis geosporum]
MLGQESGQEGSFCVRRQIVTLFIEVLQFCNNINLKGALIVREKLKEDKHSYLIN